MGQSEPCPAWADALALFRDGIDYNDWMFLLEVLMKPISASAFMPYRLKSLAVAGQFLFSPKIRAGMLGCPKVMNQYHVALRPVG